METIAEENPVYREGGVGADGTCDCIGLIMGALMRLGRKKFDMHSSNWFARYEMDTMGPVTESELEPGMIVYKGRGTGDGNWGLHDRYIDGRYATGDLTDYYHVGVVTGVRPLVITHCTSGGGTSGIVRDTKIGKWQYGGWANGISRGNEEESSMSYQAVVRSQDGLPVKMRKGADKKTTWIEKISVGSVVTVLEEQGAWRMIEHAGNTGYMMAGYLVKMDDQEKGEESESITEMIKKVLEELSEIKSMLSDGAEDENLNG